MTSSRLRSVRSRLAETAEERGVEDATSEGKSELESDFEWPSGPVFKAEIPPVSVAGVERTRYKGAYQWEMNKELTDLIKNGTFKEYLKGTILD